MSWQAREEGDLCLEVLDLAVDPVASGLYSSLFCYSAAAVLTMIAVAAAVAYANVYASTLKKNTVIRSFSIDSLLIPYPLTKSNAFALDFFACVPHAYKLYCRW